MIIKEKPEGGYSPTQAGYEAWLEDGNIGNFEDFLEECVKFVGREVVIKSIMKELDKLSKEELEEALAFIQTIR